MIKSELRKLRALPATKEMMEKGKRFKEEKRSYYYRRVETVIVSDYTLLVRVQNLSGYIKIAIFLPEDMRKEIRTPRYEVFLNVEGGEYITRELDDKGQEKRWLTSMIENLEEFKYDYTQCRSIWDGPIFMSNDAIRTLNRLKLEKIWGREKKGMERLRYWQQEQKDKQTLIKEKREQKPWDEDMALVPKAPAKFEEWMRRNAANEYYVFYDYDPAGAKQGYCSKCKNNIPIVKPKTGKVTVCPKCRAQAIFKPSGKIQTTETGTYYAEVIQKFDGGIVIRGYSQRQWYRDRHYKNPHIFTLEENRTMIFDNGTIKRYEYGSYKQKYSRWILDKDHVTGGRSYYWQKREVLYKRNLKALKSSNILKNSAVDLWKTLPTDFANYLEVEKGNPAVEMLARIGMFELAEELILEPYDKDLLDQEATELSKMLRLDKSRLRRLKDMDGNICCVKWLQEEKKKDTIWPNDVLIKLAVANINPNDFGFLEFKTSNRHKLSPVKIVNYLEKQMEKTEDTMEQTLITWKDYMNMAKKIKMNIQNEQIAMPKSLEKAHAEAILIIESRGLDKRAKELVKKWPKVEENLSKLAKFEYSQGDYQIVAPKNILDIVREGTILKHCVHTCDYYFDRIQKDESYLFFLRKANIPEMPWYTLEVELSGNIRQKRTTGDNQNQDFENAKLFLKRWQKYFRSQLTDEEKALGVIADQRRKENYNSLRKNGNRVWHGKLAGQLLADVLEADFMAAE